MAAPVLNWPLKEFSVAPAEHEVHVWAFPLDATPAGIAACAAVLSAEEMERANQFRMDHLRRRYIVAHGVMRKLLGTCLQCGPETFDYAFSTRGKPRLEGRNLEFNLAHSDELGLLAVTRGSVVGVDVERVRPMPDGLDIARRFFSAREVADFETIAASAHDDAFFNLWTRKESWLKATGDGISESLSKVEFTFRPGETARVLAIAGDEEAAAEWSLYDLNPAVGFTGALALPRLGATVNCWRFDPDA